MTGRRTAFLVLLLAALFAAAPASANLKLCNRTSYILYAATAVVTADKAETQGWTRITPGSCEEALSKPLTPARYYVYAQSSRSHAGPSRAWGGSYKFCVRHGQFTLNTPSLGGCAAEDSFAVGFNEVPTRSQKDFTETLTGHEDLTTLSEARIAGLQRLLSDNGYEIAHIDGNDDKETETALAAFRHKAKLSRKAADGPLFQALEKAAGNISAPSGYSVCNTTDKPFWAAIGQKDGQKWISRGWWKVPPASCATAISEPLRTDRIYVFADLPGQKPLVGGNEKFCITDIAFEIEGRGNCSSRGLREAGFAATDVRGRDGYVARIGPKGLIPMPPRRNSSSASASHPR